MTDATHACGTCSVRWSPPAGRWSSGTIWSGTPCSASRSRTGSCTACSPRTADDCTPRGLVPASSEHTGATPLHGEDAAACDVLSHPQASHAAGEPSAALSASLSSPRCAPSGPPAGAVPPPAEFAGSAELDSAAQAAAAHPKGRLPSPSALARASLAGWPSPAALLVPGGDFNGAALSMAAAVAACATAAAAR